MACCGDVRTSVGGVVVGGDVYFLDCRNIYLEPFLPQNTMLTLIYYSKV